MADSKGGRPPGPDSEKVQRAYEKAVKAYGQRAYVTGVDVGYKYDGGLRTDDIAVRIHVREKIPLAALEAAEVLPSEIDGVPVDVIQGHYSPSSNGNILTLLSRRHRRDPIQPGISISHPLVSAGTIGAVVYDRSDGQACALSNWHVLAGSTVAQPGDQALQPGTFDGGRRHHDAVGTLRRMMLGRRGDAAIAALDTEREIQTAQFETGVEVRAARRVRIGDRVTKSGRTTGVTRGVVDGIGRYRLTYPVGAREVEGFIIRTETEGNPDNVEISGGGDSGSLWYDPDSAEGLGLHFAGETDPAPAAEYALACHLDAVLDELHVSLEPIAPGEEDPLPAEPAAPAGGGASGGGGGGGGGPTLADLLSGAGVSDEVLRQLPPTADLDGTLAARGLRMTEGPDGKIEIEIDPSKARGKIRITFEPG